MEGNQVGQERRTHSTVAAAVLVHPLPAMDINTSQKSKSQSKRINRCDLFGFQCLADLFELSVSYNMYKWYSLHLNQSKENTECSWCAPMLIWWGFYSSIVFFFPWKKAHITSCLLKSWWDVLGVKRFSQTLPSWNQLVTWQLLKCILRKF